MYTNLWLKYLPVIRIVLKRSLLGEQMLAINVSDFQHAGLKNKSGYKFHIRLKKGKLHDIIIDNALASSLITALLADNSIKELISTNEFEISFNTKFQLSIKHIPVKEEAETVEAK